MGILQRTPGRHVTRRLEDVRLVGLARNEVGVLAEKLAAAHWGAVREYGSNSGGFHAFDPETGGTAGVFDGGPFPAGTVVTPLSWGRIDAATAQRLLEADGVA